MKRLSTSSGQSILYIIVVSNIREASELFINLYILDIIFEKDVNREYATI